MWFWASLEPAICRGTRFVHLPHTAAACEPVGVQAYHRTQVASCGTPAACSGVVSEASSAYLLSRTGGTLQWLCRWACGSCTCLIEAAPAVLQVRVMLPFYECLPEGQLGPLQHERDFDVPKASQCAVHPVSLNAGSPLEACCLCQHRPRGA